MIFLGQLPGRPTAAAEVAAGVAKVRTETERAADQKAYAEIAVLARYGELF